MDVVHDRVRRRGAARLHARLPLLPGRHGLPPRARAHRRRDRARRARRARVHRLRRGLADVAVDDRPQPARGGACDGSSRRLAGTGVSVSLPSLRVDAFGVEMARLVSAGGKKSGLTFAPEAGTQRMRDVINKNVTEEDLLGTVQRAFAAGWRRVKLYFMIGLPTETDEDVVGIGELVDRVLAAAKAATPPNAARLGPGRPCRSRRSCPRRTRRSSGRRSSRSRRSGGARRCCARRCRARASTCTGTTPTSRSSRACSRAAAASSPTSSRPRGARARASTRGRSASGSRRWLDAFAESGVDPLGVAHRRALARRAAAVGPPLGRRDPRATWSRSASVRSARRVDPGLQLRGLHGLRRLRATSASTSSGG